jgi:hypothetical protein
VVVALLPIVPKPMPGKSGPDVPAFIADGTWRRYVDARHTLVTAPPANNTVGLKAVYWQAVTMQGYNQPGGYFIGPDEHGVGQWGPIHRPTFDVLINIALTGRKPTVTAQMKQDAVTDLRYWKAAIVVLDLQDPNVEEQWETVTALTGITPTFQDGVWVWDVRPLVGESGR